MTLIRPFKGLRPLPQFAEQVIAPPYDVLNTEEARARALGRPWSFLHISKPEIDLPSQTDPYDPIVYAKGSENLLAMIENTILAQDHNSCYYVYRLIMGDHIQVGLVALASVADYNTNRIRKHEFTRPDKEDDRVRQIDALNAQTGPVFLTYRYNDEVDALVDSIMRAKPDYDLTADDRVQHTLWVLTHHEKVEHLTAVFDAMDALYIADGHHRSAAASRIAVMRANNNPTHNGTEGYNYFLSVIFPDNQVKILDYNRVVKDLNGLSSEEFVARVSERFGIEASSQPIKPGSRGEFGMYLKNQWYRLTIQNQTISNQDPVACLDVSLLSANLIEPILAIRDPRRDKRIDFVGGIRGLSELETRVNSGEMAVAFSLFPTALEELMAVADADKVMPPKSTWFEPKLADGLVSHWLKE